VEWTADGELVVGPDGVAVYDERVGLRTVDAVSPSVRSNQVLGSVVGFGLIYTLLAAVWLFVLDRKIRQGPEPPGHRDDIEGDLLDAAAARPAMAGDLTGDRRDTADETA
jgi:hypothetical protein